MISLKTYIGIYACFISAMMLKKYIAVPYHNVYDSSDVGFIDYAC